MHPLERTHIAEVQEAQDIRRAAAARKRTESQDAQPPAEQEADLALAKYDADDERRLFNAGVDLLRALEQYQGVAREYEKGGGYMELDDEMKHLAWASHSLQSELLDLRRAIDVIEEDIPIAARSGNDRAWKPYLSPKWLLYFLDLAKPGDTGYISQLKALMVKEAARELDAKCGRDTAAGTPCQAVPLYWPGRGRDSACNRHLTDEERPVLQKAWDDIEAAQACPGCLAQPGEPCSEDASTLVLVDGEWPRIRNFAPRKMHDVRLALA